MNNDNAKLYRAFVDDAEAALRVSTTGMGDKIQVIENVFKGSNYVVRVVEENSVDSGFFYVRICRNTDDYFLVAQFNITFFLCCDFPTPVTVQLYGGTEDGFYTTLDKKFEDLEDLVVYVKSKLDNQYNP